MQLTIDDVAPPTDQSAMTAPDLRAWLDQLHALTDAYRIGATDVPSQAFWLNDWTHGVVAAHLGPERNCPRKWLRNDLIPVVRELITATAGGEA